MKNTATHQTFLKGNPSFEEIKKACAELFKQAHIACRRILRELKKQRSCLAPMGVREAVLPRYYNPIRTAASFKYWREQTIPSLLVEVSEDIIAMEDREYKDKKYAMLKKVREQIAMEETLCHALETLSKKSN